MQCGWFDKSSYGTDVAVDGVWSSSKALLHALFNILGRYHEHERADRVNYLQVIERNVIEGVHTRMYNLNHRKIIIVGKVICFLQ